MFWAYSKRENMKYGVLRQWRGGCLRNDTKAGLVQRWRVWEPIGCCTETEVHTLLLKVPSPLPSVVLNRQETIGMRLSLYYEFL